MRNIFILSLLSLTFSVAYSKEPVKKDKKPTHAQKSKGITKAKPGSWDQEDFNSKEEGRGVANDQKDAESPQPKYWDYKED